jgi:phage-related protein
MVVSLTVQTDHAEWIKETSTTHIMSNDDNTGLDFPYDFNYDFKNEYVNRKIINDGFMASNFILNIEGYAVNPTLFIGNHKYSVDVTVGVGEVLTIDSLNKTITLNKSGELVNCFKNRCKDSYIFEKIPSGENVVSSDNEQLKFTLILIEERSEPKWT